MKKITKPENRKLEKQGKAPFRRMAAALLLSGAMGCGADADVKTEPYQLEDQNAGCRITLDTCETQTIHFREEGKGRNSYEIDGAVFSFRELGISEDTAIFHVAACGDLIEYELPVNRLMSLTQRDAEFHVMIQSVQQDEIGLKVTTAITPVCE
ncbi:hypothetical protein JXA56_00045 [Candidatus Micrarchaeota archaeon]|nr:hypothetical protein [Candidatus Micrarchaeota archaeon]